MSKHDNWMPLYVGDYLADTAHLDGAQSGAYLHLLMHYWRAGPLPNDDGQLAAIAKTPPKAWKTMKAIVRAFFTVGGDGCLHQKRMDAERSRWSDISDKRRDAGRRGAESKWRPGNSPDPTPPPPDKPPNGHDKPMANAMASAKQMPSGNVANASRLPRNCQGFANAPLPVQSNNIIYLKEESLSRARAREEPLSSDPAVAGLLKSLGRDIRHFALAGKKPERDKWRQLEELQPPRLGAKHLTPEQLAVARKRGPRCA